MICLVLPWDAEQFPARNEDEVAADWCIDAFFVSSRRGGRREPGEQESPRVENPDMESWVFMTGLVLSLKLALA